MVDKREQLLKAFNDFGDIDITKNQIYCIYRSAYDCLGRLPITFFNLVINKIELQIPDNIQLNQEDIEIFTGMYLEKLYQHYLKLESRLGSAIAEIALVDLFRNAFCATLYKINKKKVTVQECLDFCVKNFTIRFDETGYAEVVKLRELYNFWAFNNKLPSIDKSKFGVEMKKLGFHKVRKQVGEKRIPCYKGIILL